MRTGQHVGPFVVSWAAFTHRKLVAPPALCRWNWVRTMNGQVVANHISTGTGPVGIARFHHLVNRLPVGGL